MTALAALQKRFQQSVLQSGASATAWINAGGRANPASQLAIYKHAYRARLQEVLSNDFPATQKAMGDALFLQLAEDYIQACPSRYYSLRRFGRHLPSFISGQWYSSHGYHDQPWLAELAFFEWSLGQAFDAADAKALTEQEMTGFAAHIWPALGFSLHPSVRVLHMHWNTPGIWQSLTAGRPVRVSAEHGGASPWLIWRQQLVTRFRSLADDEQQALNLLRHGRTFSDLCDHLATLMSDTEVPVRAAGLLKGWIGQGLISDVRKPCG